MKILITGGGCREAIDSVRYVTNSSTGGTSAVIADYFSQHKADVTLITAASAIRPQTICNIKTFVSGADLQKILESEIRSTCYDCIIHCAAVSDYVPLQVMLKDPVSGNILKTYQASNTGKIPSGISGVSNAEMIVSFSSAPKILDSIKNWASQNKQCESKKSPLVICFKLTSGDDIQHRENACLSILTRGTADIVVSNDLHDITERKHSFFLARLDNGTIVQTSTGSTSFDLAKALYEVTQSYLNDLTMEKK